MSLNSLWKEICEPDLKGLTRSRAEPMKCARLEYENYAPQTKSKEAAYSRPSGKPAEPGICFNNRGQYGNNNGMTGGSHGPPGMHQQMSGQQNASPVMNPMAAQNPMAQQ